MLINEMKEGNELSEVLSSLSCEKDEDIISSTGYVKSHEKGIRWIQCKDTWRQLAEDI